ncbi:hypothetical protein ACIA5G_22335 [Amycolatopsis sp. NPDC051758]|uniref:hypothetical protein n=1 Tax=Amycolatopsis sp. NPDC051758 TaxID=3363935 RepID=UPI003794EF53
MPDDKPPEKPPVHPKPPPASPPSPQPGPPGAKADGKADGKAGSEPAGKAEDKLDEKVTTPAPEADVERDSAVRNVQEDASVLEQTEMGRYVSRGINQFNAETIIFTSSYDEEFVESAPRAGQRRAPRLQYSEADLDQATESFVEPPGFRGELDLLADRNLVVLAGPLRTGKRTRALQLLKTTLREAGLDEAVEEVSASALTNPLWRVPRKDTGFVVFDEPGRKDAFSAAKIGEEWLRNTAQRLHESGSFLVVVTGPPSGSLATAPSRAEFVLDEWEPPDSVEILHRRLRDTMPSEADELIERLGRTELPEVLAERDSPAFAVRAAKEIGESHRAGRSLEETAAKLGNAEGLVHEWLSREPEVKDLSLVLATAVLDDTGYLKVADAAVSLYQRLSGGSSAPTTLRYAPRLHADHTWLQRVPAEDSRRAPTLRFRHPRVRPAVLKVVWCGYDGARGKILEWLKELALHADVEIRAGVAQAIGILAQQDFQHGVHEYLQPWGRESSQLLRQTAALGLNVAGALGDDRAAWSLLERWATFAYRENTENVCITAALAAGGPLGIGNPRRALGVLRDFVVCPDKWDVLGSVAASARALVGAGCGREVLEALCDWTGADADKDALVKALLVFACVVEPDNDDAWPVVLRAADENRELITRLWCRAMADGIVRETALGELRSWVRRVDEDASAEPVVLGLVADIADTSPGDRDRVRHALSQWAQDRYRPSMAAATFYDLMDEAEEEVS